MVRNPRFKGLWYEYDGKPLTVILDTGAMGVKEGKTETAFRVPFFKQTLGWTAEQIDDLRRRNPPVDSLALYDPLDVVAKPTDRTR